MTVNWTAFLARHDMLFPSLPQSWREAPHFGNAMVGSMLYMRNNRLCLEIFRADVHDHRDDRHGWTAYSRSRFRIGYFTLETVGVPTGCHWRKDLWNAELTGTITTDQGNIDIHHFVHAGDMAIVTRLTPDEGEKDLSWTWHPYEAKTTRPGYPTTPEEVTAFAKRYGNHYQDTIQPPSPNPAGRLERRDGVSVWIQDLLAGGQYATAWTEKQTRGTRAHIVTTANTFPESHAAESAVADIAAFAEKMNAETGRSTWIGTHRAWWHGYFPQSFVAIPDKELESLYWQTIYRFGCTSRSGRYYVDTAGLWFQGGPWPYTTNDWNTQAAHWGVYAANRLDQGRELVNRLYKNRQNLIDAVFPEAWRQDSAYLHLATAGDMAGTRISDRRYYDCVGCLPWLLHNAWWQYRFSMDESMLRETVFPLLKRAVNLYFHLAETAEDGTIHLRPTYSPETGVWQDCNFDLALFKWGCHSLLEACQRLRIDDPLIPRWREVIENLIDFPTDEKGFMLGGDQTAWDDHRHLSHLLMIYPLFLVNREREETVDALKRSNDSAQRSAGSENGSIEDLVAMVQTHAGPIACALGDGDQALAGLKRVQIELTPTGLWSCNNNPCIESTLGLANTIQAMLIQSWRDPAHEGPGPIRVFPALPSTWRDVEFHDLRAQGAFLVSAKRASGKTDWVSIKSLVGEPCRVSPGMIEPFKVTGEREFSCQEVTPGVFAVDLKKGETITLSAKLPETHD